MHFCSVMFEISSLYFGWVELSARPLLSHVMSSELLFLVLLKKLNRINKELHDDYILIDEVEEKCSVIMRISGRIMGNLPLTTK